MIQHQVKPMGVEKLILEFEMAIKEIERQYLLLPDEYFFTEKDLHSYFHHLCFSNDCFTFRDKLNLVHAEYPTPFKCSIEKTPPFFKIQDSDSRYMRSHVDLVLLNPNFVEWISNFTKNIEYVKGLRNALFSEYIRDFISKYEQFYEETKESVLLYALEFKYFRSSYEGTKYPVISIIQDVEKLKKVKSFKLDFMEKELPFARKAMSLVFVGDKNKGVVDGYNIDEYCKANANIVRLVVTTQQPK